MTMCLKQHITLIDTTKHLDTLRGSANAKRRTLKNAHTANDGACMWCGVKTFLWWEVTSEQFKQLNSDHLATFEHIKPKSMGGGNKVSNAGCSCSGCNALRGTIPAKQWEYITQNPERFQRYKDKVEIRKRPVREKNEFKRMIRHLKLLSKKQKMRQNLFSLAVMFELFKKYKHVDFCLQFDYNRKMIRKLGELYGLF